jgi:hypothetical protein
MISGREPADSAFWGMGMFRRVGLWGLAGLGVACFWVTIGILSGPAYSFSRWAIAVITAPASLLGRTMPLAYYSFALLNAATYGMLGLGAELIMRQHRQRRSLR